MFLPESNPTLTPLRALRIVAEDAEKREREKTKFTLLDQHAISVGIKPVFLFDRMPVGGKGVLLPRECTNQH